MPYLRRNVYELGTAWADPILWYARGVAVMKSRGLAQPTSWRFYGAIHGIDPGLWTHFGYLSALDPMPSDALIKRFWRQCQHGSWYFLPWHRGYVLAFEANVRAAVVELGGPADWALPYWNYFKPGQNRLPLAFATPDWPDGKGNNPLFVEPRFGPGPFGTPGETGVYVPMNRVNLLAMADPDFTGATNGGSPGFGGVDTGFSHGGSVHGGLETQPHDYVHGLVGGTDPKDQDYSGLMGDPDTAGLDPIFWLHHGNIDRLWSVWRVNPRSHVDPTETSWLEGPASNGERPFCMPMPDGSTWTYKPSEMVDTGRLGYAYDDLAPAPATVQGVKLLVSSLPQVDFEGSAAVPKVRDVEMVGASESAVSLSGRGAASSIRMAPTGTARLKAARTAQLTAAASIAPERVFLNLENVKSKVDGIVFDVYVGLTNAADPGAHPDNLAGSIALFGVRKASLVDDEHAGKGITFVLDITDVAARADLTGESADGSLPVRLVPLSDVPEAAQVEVGRISVYYQKP